ncbi:MAG: uroporphyrinogen decarboxylase family protein [Candidatus Ratteibacteria bacterium]
MNNKERFVRTLNFEKVDHPPILLDGPWPDTLKRWYKEGLPENISLYEYFEVDDLKFVYAGPDTGPYPPFEEKVLYENENEIIKIDRYGRKVRDFKNSTSMPEWIEFPVKNKSDLERIIKERFDISLIKERWHKDIEEKIKIWKNNGRDYILFLDGGCYYGILRNLAGVEYSSYLFYDAPELIDELFERINIICVEGLNKILPEIKVDYLGFGEDIAFKTSTLISPEMFKNFLFPRYKKVCDIAKKYGVNITIYDSDGNLNPFMNLYFECGIDGFIPCEVAADMEPVELRRRYGKKIKMIGGIDKREIAKGKNEIKKEIYKKVKVIEEGGYIPKIDHSVSSDISLENYSYYIKVLKEIYGIK